jgi:hypothetical protein
VGDERVDFALLFGGGPTGGIVGALLTIAFLTAGLASARLLGVLIDGGVSSYTVMGLAFETVSASLALGASAGISVFATGGIGGVHRGAAASFDVSADLTELVTLRKTIADERDALSRDRDKSEKDGAKSVRRNPSEMRSDFQLSFQTPAHTLVE